MAAKEMTIETKTKHKKKKIKKFFKEVEMMTETEEEKKVIGFVEKAALAVAAFM